ncbi:MAG TPA: hypothetical protein PLH31_11790 [Caulobacter sp.]|nr:hypothetical protein [Caulobacter sp.]
MAASAIKDTDVVRRRCRFMIVSPQETPMLGHICFFQRRQKSPQQRFLALLTNNLAAKMTVAVTLVCERVKGKIDPKFKNDSAVYGKT